MLVSEQSGTTTRAASSRFFCQRSAAMEMVMILLVSAAAQLVSPASTPPPSVHLNSIIDLVSNKTSTLTKVRAPLKNTICCVCNVYLENIHDEVNVIIFWPHRTPLWRMCRSWLKRDVR